MFHAEKEMDVVLGRLLRAGVLVSAVIVIVGGALYVMRHGSQLPEYKTFTGEPSDLRTISGILKDASHFQARGLIQLGLLFLIATPVLRVAFSVFAFARLGDHKYVVITLIVLALLCWSLFASR